MRYGVNVGTTSNIALQSEVLLLSFAKVASAFACVVVYFNTVVVRSLSILLTLLLELIIIFLLSLLLLGRTFVYLALQVFCTGLYSGVHFMSNKRVRSNGKSSCYVNISIK